MCEPSGALLPPGYLGVDVEYGPLIYPSQGERTWGVYSPASTNRWLRTAPEGHEFQFVECI